MAPTKVAEETAVQEREPTLRTLLARLLSTRARRDAAPRFSDPWRAADHEMHEIERAIFRVPFEPTTDARSLASDPDDEPTPLHPAPPSAERVAHEDVLEGERAG